MSGKVYLVGAGPGDPEMLTVKAVRILREADVVLHDDLVPAAIVKLGAPGALVSNVGKRCGKKRVTQAQIHALMVDYARRGLTVVRLKGGDPLIFGRAGEEIDALAAAGIEYEIVPGVTAASCAAASAGISLTDRRAASSLVFLSGHPGADKLRNDWLRLESKNTDTQAATVVVYMPGTDYAKLRAELYEAGLNHNSPCLLVSGASTGASQTYPTSLDKLSDAPPLASPKILIVGEVVRRRSSSKRATAAPSREMETARAKQARGVHRRSGKENRRPVLVRQA